MAVLTPAIEELVGLVARPDEPVGSGNSWTSVEHRLSLSFPEEYKQLVQVFGTGPWANFFHVLSPFTTSNLDLERRALLALGALHEVRRRRPDEVPFAVYPEPLGLFPWALTDNGDTVCWLTEGYQWPVVIFSPRDPEFEVHRVSPASLITAFLRGTIASPCLLDPFEGEQPLKSHHW